MVDKAFGVCRVTPVKSVPGEKIKAVRKQLGETQREFARRLSVNRTTISRWEAFGVPNYGPQKMAASYLLNLVGTDKES